MPPLRWPANKCRSRSRVCCAKSPKALSEEAPMYAVIFEVEPKPDQFEEYLAIAGRLRPELERIDGFIDNERFRDLARPGCVLSLSTWRDEASLIRWRLLAV